MSSDVDRYEILCWKNRIIDLFQGHKEYIFVRDGHRMTTNTIRNRLRKVCKKLKITERSPHKVRKTYYSILFENQLDTKLI